MNNTFPQILFKMLAIISLCYLFHHAGAEESPFPLQHVITDQKGRKLEATILGIKGSVVSMRRASDSKEFAIDLSQLSEADRLFLQKLGGTPSTSSAAHPNPSDEWIIEDFGEKLISPGARFQLSLAVGKNGPVIGYSDMHNIQLIQKNPEAWNSTIVNKFSEVADSFNTRIIIGLDDYGQPHLFYTHGKSFNVLLFHATYQDAAWVNSSIAYKGSFASEFGDILVANGTPKMIMVYRGFNVDVFEYDKTTINKILADGGHKQDARFTDDGKVFAVTDLFIIDGKATPKLNFCEISKLHSTSVPKEIIKTFETKAGKYLARIATNRKNLFSVACFYGDEFLYAVRRGNVDGAGSIDGNWNVNSYQKSEFKIEIPKVNIIGNDPLVDYKMATNGISYMLYNSSDGDVHIARLTTDGNCLIDNLGKGKGICLAIDSDGNPHVLFEQHNGVVNYARCTINAENLPASEKITIRDVRVIKKNTPLLGHINHAEKKAVDAAGDPTPQ